VVLLEGRFPQHFPLPVGIHATVNGIGGLPRVALLFVGDFNELLGVEQVKEVDGLGNTQVVVIGHPEFSPGALFGGDQHDAVGGPGAVNGGGRTILEDFHRLNVGRVDIGQGVVGGISPQSTRGYRNPVDHNQWIGS